jgi:hypothetical protein
MAELNTLSPALIPDGISRLVDELINRIGQDETIIYLQQRIDALSNGLDVFTPNEIFLVVCEFFRVRVADVRAKEDFTPNKRKAIRTTCYVMAVWFNYRNPLIASVIDRHKSQVSRYIKEIYSLSKKTPAESRWLGEIENLRSYYRMQMVLDKYQELTQSQKQNT